MSADTEALACLAISPDGLRACAYAPGHEGPHGWERSETEALLATVREARNVWKDEKALAALDSFAAELERLRVEGARSEESRVTFKRLLADAEAELERVKAERDKALETAEALRENWGRDADLLGTRLDKALAALRNIQQAAEHRQQDGVNDQGWISASWIEDRAIAAIAEIKGEA